MAVVEMQKLNLVALAYDRDKILNALQRTQATEIKLHGEIENTVPLETDTEALRTRLARCEDALKVILSRAVNYYKKNKIKSDNVGEVEVTYLDFKNAREKADEYERLTDRINELLEGEKELSIELSKLRRTISSAEVYAGLDIPLHTENTAHTHVRLGTLPVRRSDAFELSAESVPLLSYEFLGGNAENRLILLALHKSAQDDVRELMQSFGFSACPFDEERTGAELYSSLRYKEAEILARMQDIDDELVSFDKYIREMKIYCDFIGFELEKAEESQKMRRTDATFLLEAYVPSEAQEGVKRAVDEATDTVWYGFSKPSEDETPPTLLKNKKLVKNFEAVTDMYSAVNYNEFDPNAVMGFFYSLFLGFIMGDVIYGLLMTVLGGFIYLKQKRETGMKKIAGVFAIGGVFAVLWGILFNSFLGMNALPFTVMPDAKSGRYTLMGIKIPSVLVISMLIGMVQLCAGYVCLAVQCWRKGDIWGGIFDGVSWAAFMIGVMLAVIGLVDEFNISSLAIAGGIIAGGSLLLAVLTAGRKEKLLGKFTKGFGAAYGVINIVSDILSYARLYGLMLSGAVIAQIISGFVVTGYEGSTPFFFSGNPLLIILGVFLMVVGHAFNLAIGLLGAYIHDARLQYVEFYGRFFEGEGSPFRPLGSRFRYTRPVLSETN